MSILIFIYMNHFIVREWSFGRLLDVNLKRIFLSFMMTRTLNAPSTSNSSMDMNDWTKKALKQKSEVQLKEPR